MRGVRGLLVGNMGLSAVLLAGCLRSTLPSDAPQIHTDASVRGAKVVAPPLPSLNSPEKGGGTTTPPSDYLVSRSETVRPNVQPALAQPKMPEAPAEKTVEPVDMRIKSEAPSPPPQPPQTQVEVHAVPLTRPDAPSVQVLRGLLENHPEAEVNEQLKAYDSDTREVILLLLSSIVQVEQKGGVSRISPRDLAAWSERLNRLTASLRGRAQLILERMCFCSSIKNFGDFTPLPPEHTFFQPGELAHIYVQGRNFSCRREGDKFVTVLKGRLEIYDGSNRDRPQATWNGKCLMDVCASPRQDYYINFRFEVPPGCPPGFYTLRLAVEDWTDAPAGAKTVPESRIAQRTLDFRVGGPISRPPRNRIAEAATRR